MVPRNSICRARAIAVALAAAACAACGQDAASSQGQGADAHIDVISADDGGAGGSADGSGGTDAEGPTPGCEVDADCPAATWPCFVARCSPTVGCVVAPAAAGEACDDGDACTEDTVCVEGSCGGGASTCQCATSADCPPVREGDLCAGSRYCDKGADPPACVLNPASVVSCAASSDPCVVVACDPKDGLCKAAPAPDGTACDDGDACTPADACAAGSCVAGVDVCGCHSHLDCAAQDDGDLCNGTLYCDTETFPFGCKTNPATVVVCPVGAPEPCHAVQCEPATGACVAKALPDGAACEDGDACTTDACVGGACEAVALSCPCTNDADCGPVDAGNLCLGSRFCDLGAAVPGCVLDPLTVVSCDTSSDGPCAATLCQPKSGKCLPVALAGQVTCSDGNACTEGDACVGGACKGGDYACSCEADADCAPFEDGDLCNGTLYCDTTSAPFVCRVNPKTVVSCPAALGGQCATAKCVPDKGTCAVEPKADGLACDADGSPCTPVDACASGACVADVNVCPCVDNADCAAAEDGDACNGTLFCNKSALPFVCTPDPNTVVVCDAGDDSTCSAAACDPKTGACAQKPRNQGAKCNADNNACTPNDACDLGTCVTDTNACLCESDGDCAASEDGDACNGTLFCDKSSFPFACAVNPATVVVCPPSGPCAQSACVAETGACVVDAVADGSACEDGLECTKGDGCQAGACVGGASVCGCSSDADCAKLDSDDQCATKLYCDQDADPPACKPSPAGPTICPQPASPCLQASCAPKTGACEVGVKKSAAGGPCTDGDACTVGDACGAEGCVGVAIDCDDNNACTADGCDATLGCTYKAIAGACDDGDACTLADACKAGACVSGLAKPCDDGAACTDDGCDEARGACVFTPKPAAAKVPCDDHNACTAGDVCGAKGCAGVAIVCDDQSGCTADFCDPKSGCVFAEVQGACDDGDTCTAGDACGGGVCKAGKAVACDDGNVCTTEVCVNGKGCVASAAGGGKAVPCDDGNVCTSGDACQDGVCKGGTNACACSVDADCAASDDGNPCNGVLVCDTTSAPYACKVKAGSVVTCAPNADPCLDNVCNPKTGACAPVASNEGGGCDADGSLCTVGDACKTGVCKAGVAIACDDGNPCTADSCAPSKGCVFAPIEQGGGASSCDDGNACTSGDLCAKGACVGGALKVCDDGNPCTDDSCDVKLGCQA